MKKKLIMKSQALLLAILCIFNLLIVILPMHTSAADVTEAEMDKIESIKLSATKYEFNDNAGYLFNFNDTVKEYSNGIQEMGSLVVEGEGITLKSYNGFQAIATNSQTKSVTIKYKQQVSTNFCGNQTWKLSSDTADTVANKKIGTLASGAWLVYKSYDGVTWIYSTSTVDINNKEVSYTISGDDINRGVYIKILSVAEIYYEYISGYHTSYSNWWDQLWGINGKKVADYSKKYKNIGSSYEFYIASDSADIAIRSEGQVNEFDTDSLEGIELSETEVSIIRRSLTLLNDSVSFSSIVVDFLSKKTDCVTVSYNDCEEKAVKDGDKFDKAGKYVFNIKSIFGTCNKKTVYIVDSEDGLFTEYFSNGITDPSVRMFSQKYAVPVYMTGMKVKFGSSNEFLPGLYGTLEFSADGENITVIETFNGLHEVYECSLTEEGVYIVHLYSSNPYVASGEIIEYLFLFAISEDIEYKPTINEKLLKSTTRNILFSRKVLSVAISSSGGGNFLYTFPANEKYYSMAKELAEKIEYLSIESFEDSNGTPYWYYKSKDNPYIKVKYEGDIGKERMYEVVNYYASLNVSQAYIEPGSSYAVMPIDDDGIEVLRDITKQSIENDVRVILSEDLKTALQAEEIYLNNFQFEQFADYETSMIKATTLDGKTYFIQYNTDLSTIFNRTMKLHIKESNWNGSTDYDVIYYAQGDNQGKLNILVDDKIVEIDKGSNKESFEGNRVQISFAGDDFDSQSILIAYNPSTGERRVMLLSESSGLYIPKGEWQISIINRFECGYSFNITVNGEEISDELPTIRTKSSDSGTFSFTYTEVDDAIETVSNTDSDILPKANFNFGWIFIIGAGLIAIIGVTVAIRKKFW